MSHSELSPRGAAVVSIFPSRLAGICTLPLTALVWALSQSRLPLHGLFCFRSGTPSAVSLGSQGLGHFHRGQLPTVPRPACDPPTMSTASSLLCRGWGCSLCLKSPRSPSTPPPHRAVRPMLGPTPCCTAGPERASDSLSGLQRKAGLDWAI